MRILIRTSRWAIWSRRFVSFALPLAVFSVLLHRNHVITSEIFLFLLMLIFALAVVTLISSAVAFWRLWYTGDKGWSRTIQATILALVMLIPMAVGALKLAQFPAGNDVTTAQAGNPVLLFAQNPRHRIFEISEVIQNWPNAVARTYPIDAQSLLDITEQLVLDRGWEIWRKRDALADTSGGQINAVATTLLGWRDEVSISVTNTVDGARIDMRSASFWSFHDLGANGARIEKFLTSLDAQVDTIVRETPIDPAPSDVDES